MIDKFYVMNREQELLLDGVASRSREDSVTLSLHNFDLAPFAQVAERIGYYIEGRTNGSAAMKSVLRGGEITADILLDSVEVNDIPAPPMRLASRWDFARSRARVTVSDRIRRDTLIRGFYAPDRNRYFARLDVDSLDMALLDAEFLRVSSPRPRAWPRPACRVPGPGPQGRSRRRNPGRGAENHGRFHAGDLLDARGRAEREEQPVRFSSTISTPGATGGGSIST